MRLFAFFLAACVALAVLRAAILVIILAYVFLLALGLVFEPERTLGFLLFCGLWALAGAHPLFTVIAGLLAFAVALARSQQDAN